MVYDGEYTLKWFCDLNSEYTGKSQIWINEEQENQFWASFDKI